jgi:hypothetical protein
MLQFPLEIMILAPLSRVLSFDSGNLLNLTLQPHFITQVVLSLPNLLEPTAIFFLFISSTVRSTIPYNSLISACVMPSLAFCSVEILLYSSIVVCILFYISVICVFASSDNILIFKVTASYSAFIYSATRR